MLPTDFTALRTKETNSSLRATNPIKRDISQALFHIREQVNNDPEIFLEKLKSEHVCKAI